MEWFISTCAIAITAFAATNIDNFLVLTTYFAQANANFRPRHILIGQYIGFAGLILASLPGYFISGLIIDREWIGLLGFLPLAIGIKRLRDNWRNPEQPVLIQTSTVHVSEKSPLLSRQVSQVAIVTFANGGDNIALYIPLFASSKAAALTVTLTTFTALVAVWCYIAYLFSKNPMVDKFLTRYSQSIIPFVLIGLGIYIFCQSETYHLLPFFH